MGYKKKDLLYRRYMTTGMVMIVFDSPDFDYKKGIRYLNKIEMARLQTVEEKYMKNLNDKEACNLLGDGWTIDIIAHIFKGLKLFEGECDKEGKGNG